MLINYNSTPLFGKVSFDLLFKHVYFGFQLVESLLCLLGIFPQIGAYRDDAFDLEVEFEVLLRYVLQNLSWVLELFTTVHKVHRLLFICFRLWPEIAELTLVLKQDDTRDSAREFVLVLS